MKNKLLICIINKSVMKRYIFYFIVLLASIIIFPLCTPYSSDKANQTQIQGKWMLIDVDHAMKIYDTLNIDYSKEQTYIVFDKDKCTQYMPDMNDTISFSFLIQDYKLDLFQDTVKINTFDIAMLTSDTLKLMHKTSERIYLKMKE